METYEAIRTVLAVRSYQDKPISPEVVGRIVEAGRLTGSSMNKQPWHFIVVEDKATLHRLGELARTGPYTAQAPLAVVVAVEVDSRFNISDGSRAIQSMMLAAWSEGVASNWVGFYPMSEIGPAVGLPANMEVLAVLPLGYPVKAVGKGRKKRKPLNEVASREKFGQPFER
jgi:nitroreductase